MWCFSWVLEMPPLSLHLLALPTDASLSYWNPDSSGSRSTFIFFNVSFTLSIRATSGHFLNCLLSCIQALVKSVHWNFTYNYYIFSLIGILFVSYFMCFVILYGFVFSTCIFKLVFYFLKCIKHRDCVVCLYILYLQSLWLFLLDFCLYLYPYTHHAALFPYLLMHLLFLELCLWQVWGLGWKEIFPERMHLCLFLEGASKVLL